VSDTDLVPAASVPVRPAATVMLLRDGDDGVEVFMLQRTLSAAFARGQYVFPGGKVDGDDHADEFEPFCDGLDDGAASARMGLDHGGLAWLVAAIRECFEEAGVLLARPSDGADIVRFDDPEVEGRFNSARHEVHDGTRSLVEVCEAEGLVLLTDRIHLVDHWITPVGERRRFDTRFFVAAAPEAQEPLHDDKETIASLWVRPVDALAMWKAGELQMFPPTVASLRFLEPFDSAAAAVEASEAVGVPQPILPRILLDGEGRIVGVRMPHEEGYADTPLPEHVIGGQRVDKPRSSGPTPVATRRGRSPDEPSPLG
jgi:8-oxo-dGTP pyrophosphatase MutT (NUDIX family)